MGAMDWERLTQLHPNPVKLPSTPPPPPPLPRVLQWNPKSLLAVPGFILLTGHLDSGGRQCKRKRGLGDGVANPH